MVACGALGGALGGALKVCVWMEEVAADSTEIM
jgi:hypothetical protein